MKPRIAQFRAEAMNELASFMNRTVPLLKARLMEGVKFKTDGSLFQKDKDALNAIIESQTNGIKRLRAYIDVSPYSIYLKADNHYCDSDGDPNGYHTVSYHNDHAYLCSPKLNDFDTAIFTPRDENITAQDILNAKAKLREIEDQISELQGQIYSHKKLIEG